MQAWSRVHCPTRRRFVGRASVAMTIWGARAPPSDGWSSSSIARDLMLAEASSSSGSSADAATAPYPCAKKLAPARAAIPGIGPNGAVATMMRFSFWAASLHAKVGTQDTGNTPILAPPRRLWRRGVARQHALNQAPIKLCEVSARPSPVRGSTGRRHRRPSSWAPSSGSGGASWSGTRSLPSVGKTRLGRSLQAVPKRRAMRPSLLHLTPTPIQRPHLRGKRRALSGDRRGAPCSMRKLWTTRCRAPKAAAGPSWT